MAGAIYCGFSRVTMHTMLEKYTAKNNKFLPGWREGISSDYNSVFQGFPKMLLPNDTKNNSKQIKSLKESFSRRWNPSSTKGEYLKAFSSETWNSLPLQSKQQHSIKSCSACDCNYSLQMGLFPVRSIALKRKNPISEAIEIQAKKIRVSQQLTPTSSKKALGRRILHELNPICQKSVGSDLCSVLAVTPESNVQKRQSKTEKRGTSDVFFGK